MAKVLIVEDDRDLINAYSMILKNDNHEVKESYDGKEALDALKEFTPDLILLDLLMPVMGGLDFLKEYKKIDNLQNTKVLIFTNMENFRK
jgi:CheY-like chemotaxis protein